MRGRAVYTPLRRRREFRRVHTQGRRKGDVLLHVRALPTPPPDMRTPTVRLGILVTKKFGSAVERNRFKRLVRAAMRSLGDDLQPGWDILVLPRAAHEASMPEILASLRQLLADLGVVRGAHGVEGG